MAVIRTGWLHGGSTKQFAELGRKKTPHWVCGKHRTKFLLEQVFPTFCKNLWSDANFYDCNRWNTKKRNRGELRTDIATADPAKLSLGPDFSTLDQSCRCWNFKLSLSIHASAETDYWFIVNWSWPLRLHAACPVHRQVCIAALGIKSVAMTVTLREFL